MIANSKHFYFDYKNGKYGYNTNPNRGADTFVPFKNGSLWFSVFTSNISEVNCGFQPDIIVRFINAASNYPMLICIDYINEKAVRFYRNEPNGNSGYDIDYNGYGFSYLSSGITRNSNGFTTSEQMTANNSNPIYIWCIKVS